MELKKFAEQLRARMEAEIDAISADQPDVLRSTALLIECVRRYVAELKKYLLKNKFRSIKEEIAFFKYIKPDFTSRLFYFRKLFKIQLFETTNPNETKLAFYRKQLQKIQRYLTRHQEFYHYVLSEADGSDQSYFLRTRASAKTVAFDERFSTTYDHILSRILSAEMIGSYITAGIKKIENPDSEPVTSVLTWTAAKTDLVELIYALQASEVFNKGNAGVKQIASQFESMFNVSLGNYYRVFQEIRLRKKSQTTFTESLRERLLLRLNEID